MAMDLCDYDQMRPLLERAGFLGPGSGVVEIGPGVGCLTERLAARAGKVLCYEVDRALEPVLAATVGGLDNVEIVFADVMSRDLEADAAEKLPGLSWSVCANLPYSITTPVLTKLYQARCFESIMVMVQQEVARRMCAGAGEKDYGAFSLLTQWYAQPETVFSVGPECFVPRPKVRSAVVRLSMRRTPPADVDERAFFRTVRAAFDQRRKTLPNALEGLCGKERAAEAIRACGFAETVRGERLSLSDFAALTRELAKYESI